MIGGGTSGSNVAAQLCKEREIFYHNIRVFEPIKNHFKNLMINNPSLLTKIDSDNKLNNDVGAEKINLNLQ